MFYTREIMHQSRKITNVPYVDNILSHVWDQFLVCLTLCSEV